MYSPADSEIYLSQLLGRANGTLPASASFLGWQPAYDIVRVPTRSVRSDVLGSVLRAIREGTDIDLSYQSMRQPEVCRRWIRPHAIAFDGTRWHARAWCHLRHDFRDFVFARIQRVHGHRASHIDPQDDRRWHTFTAAILRPSSDLTPQQRRAVSREFGMRSGKLRVRIREALVFYFVRQLRLDAPKSQVRNHPIELVNREELASLLVEAAR